MRVIVSCDFADRRRRNDFATPTKGTKGDRAYERSPVEFERKNDGPSMLRHTHLVYSRARIYKVILCRRKQFRVASYRSSTPQS